MSAGNAFKIQQKQIDTATSGYSLHSKLIEYNVIKGAL
jgi:hypothetical protein